MVAFLLRAGEECEDVRGKQNMNYRRAVYRAWKQGHMVVVEVIQEFKLVKYGPDDVEDVSIIVESMDPGDLGWDIKTAQDWEETLKWTQVVPTAHGSDYWVSVALLTRYVLKRTDHEMSHWGLVEAQGREKARDEMRSLKKSIPSWAPVS